ncbi:MAG: hypothetical protein WCE49_18345, partial [Terrimicrobiaceae bacterium]
SAMRGPSFALVQWPLVGAAAPAIGDVAATRVGEFSGACATDRSLFEKRLVLVRDSSITWR